MHTKCDKHFLVFCTMQRMPVLVATNARGGAHCIKFSVTHHAMATKWSRERDAEVSPPTQGLRRGCPWSAPRAVLRRWDCRLSSSDGFCTVPCLSCSSRPLLATDGFSCNRQRAVTFLVHSRIVVERVSRTCSTSFVSRGFFTKPTHVSGLVSRTKPTFLRRWLVVHHRPILCRGAKDQAEGLCTTATNVLEA